MLTLERFKALLSSYGAKPQRWPEAERADAEALLRVSEAARLLLSEAQELDDAIEAASALGHATPGSGGEQEAALLRLRARVAARIESLENDAPRRQLLSRAAAALRRVPATLRWAPAVLRPAAYPRLGWLALAAGSLVIAAGLALGSLYGSAPPADNMLALLQPAPLSIFADQ